MEESVLKFEIISIFPLKQSIQDKNFPQLFCVVASINCYLYYFHRYYLIYSKSLTGH